MFHHIHKKAAADSEFRSKLLSDPAGTLAAEGISVPEGTNIEVVEMKHDTLHVRVPALGAEISEDDLAQAAGGTFDCSGFTLL
jgi:hypothetical protein